MALTFALLALGGAFMSLKLLKDLAAITVSSQERIAELEFRQKNDELRTEKTRLKNNPGRI